MRFGCSSGTTNISLTPPDRGSSASRASAPSTSVACNMAFSPESQTRAAKKMPGANRPAPGRKVLRSISSEPGLVLQLSRAHPQTAAFPVNRQAPGSGQTRAERPSVKKQTGNGAATARVRIGRSNFHFDSKKHSVLTSKAITKLQVGRRKAISRGDFYPRNNILRTGRPRRRRCVA